MMTKDIEGLKIFIVGSVLELHADEVTGVWSRSFDELDDQS